MKEQIISEIQRLSEELNKNPTRQEFEKLNNFKITKRQLLKYFDTYTDALLATDLKPKADRRDMGTVITNCTECNEVITKNKSDIKKSTNLFCSSSCSAIYNNKLKPKKAGGLYVIVEKTCLNCQNLYSKDGRDKTNTCSKFCSMELGMKQRIMKDSIKRSRS